MVKVIFIEGSCVKSMDREEFSISDVFEFMGTSKAEMIKAEEARNKGDEDYTGFSLHEGFDVTVVTIFNNEGEEFFFIGDSNKFTNDFSEL